MGTLAAVDDTVVEDKAEEAIGADSDRIQHNHHMACKLNLALVQDCVQVQGPCQRVVKACDGTWDHLRARSHELPSHLKSSLEQLRTQAHYRQENLMRKAKVSFRTDPNL